MNKSILVSSSLASLVVLAGCAAPGPYDYGSQAYARPGDPSQWKVVSVTPVPLGTGARAAAAGETGRTTTYSPAPQAPVVVHRSPVYVQPPPVYVQPPSVYLPPPVYVPAPVYQPRYHTPRYHHTPRYYHPSRYHHPSHYYRPRYYDPPVSVGLGFSFGSGWRHHRGWGAQIGTHFPFHYRR